MSGFKNFILRGNLIELAVAVIIGVAFNDVVLKFTNWLTNQLPEGADEVFNNKENTFGAFMNAVIAFAILAAVVYFLVVMPYTKLRERFFPAEAGGTTPEVALLEEIRDLLASRQ